MLALRRDLVKDVERYVCFSAQQVTKRGNLSTVFTFMSIEGVELFPLSFSVYRGKEGCTDGRPALPPAFKGAAAEHGPGDFDRLVTPGQTAARARVPEGGW